MTQRAPVPAAAWLAALARCGFLIVWVAATAAPATAMAAPPGALGPESAAGFERWVDAVAAGAAGPGVVVEGVRIEPSEAFATIRAAAGSHTVHIGPGQSDDDTFHLDAGPAAAALPMQRLLASLEAAFPSSPWRGEAQTRKVDLLARAAQPLNRVQAWWLSALTWLALCLMAVASAWTVLADPGDG